MRFDQDRVHTCSNFTYCDKFSCGVNFMTVRAATKITKLTHHTVYPAKVPSATCSVETKLANAASAYPEVVVQSSFVAEGRCSRHRPSPAHGGPSGSQCCWPALAGTEPALSQHCQTPE